MKARYLIAPLAALTLTACAGFGGGAHPARAADGVLVNNAGMSLYTFDKDQPGKSNCNGPCAANWPPLAAKADDQPSGNWTVVTRDDGSKQWAYKGKPVYTWVKDQKPGDKTGDNFNNVWRLARE